MPIQLLGQGHSGYENANITIRIGGTYTGGGPDGYIGGTDYSFYIRERNPALDRPRQDTTDSPFKEGVPGSLSEKIRLAGYFKGSAIPPVNMATEAYIMVDMTTVNRLVFVMLVEKFEEIGIVDNAINWRIEGESDYTFTLTRS